MREPSDETLSRAAFYGLYLRRVAGLDADEAAALVAERYPRVRPFLARFTKPPVSDPLAGLKSELGETDERPR